MEKNNSVTKLLTTNQWLDQSASAIVSLVSYGLFSEQIAKLSCFKSQWWIKEKGFPGWDSVTGALVRCLVDIMLYLQGRAEHCPTYTGRSDEMKHGWRRRVRFNLNNTKASSSRCKIKPWKHTSTRARHTPSWTTKPPQKKSTLMVLNAARSRVRLWRIRHFRLIILWWPQPLSTSAGELVSWVRADSSLSSQPFCQSLVLRKRNLAGRITQLLNRIHSDDSKSTLSALAHFIPTWITHASNMFGVMVL